ncbi:gamma-aminobutyric acid receptor subunit alpha-2-like isoform X2 [Amphiura filiformis]|uniref:gamma-aminobutyric acid receptor subunit alpha-2-like isoform X2 n=1 Tax=Amphiura filiformis TaxID=82378 RepID=UPI003B224832
MCRLSILVVTLFFLTQRACSIDELETNSTSRNSLSGEEPKEEELLDIEDELVVTKESEQERKLRIEKQAAANITKILDSILDGYDSSLRPGLKGPPTEVVADIFALSIGPIIEVDMEFKIDVFFRQRWQDKRLQYEGNMDQLRLSTIMLKDVWYPDTYFLNGKSSKRHVITTPNAMFRVERDGSVLYTQRLTIVAECQMQLHKYPMDTQVCPLEIGSNSYSTDDIRYKWKYGVPHEDKSIDIDPLATMAQYTLEKKFQAYSYIKPNNRIGNRSVLVTKFTFVRHVGFFLIQTYVPCVLIVILSWVSFFLNREATPARVALGIMAILTITTMGWSSRSVLPKVSYAKAVDWFNVLCFAFVFAALVEFAAVNYFTKRRGGSLPGMEDNEDEDDCAQAASEKVDAALRRKKRFTLLSSITRYNIKVKNPRDYDKPSLCSDFLNCLSGNQEYRERRKGRSRNNDKAFNSVSKIDEISRIMFPISFIVINALFWIAYSF